MDTNLVAHFVLRGGDAAALTPTCRLTDRQAGQNISFSQSVLRGRPHHELIRSLAMRGAIRILLAIVGLVAIVLAVIYFIVPAGSLPLPDALGREAGSQVIHVKHGIAALVAGLLCWLLVWDMGSPLR